jgi:hypothetical protein
MTYSRTEQAPFGSIERTSKAGLTGTVPACGLFAQWAPLGSIEHPSGPQTTVSEPNSCWRKAADRLAAGRGLGGVEEWRSPAEVAHGTTNSAANARATIL